MTLASLQMPVAVVLSKKIDPVVVAIGSANNSVNVNLPCLVICEEQSRMVIELNEYHRTLYTIVEGIARTVSANPAEMCLAQMLFELRHLCMARSVGHLADIGLNKIEERVARTYVETGGFDALERHDSIVLVGTAKHQVVSKMDAAFDRSFETTISWPSRPFLSEANFIRHSPEP